MYGFQSKDIAVQKQAELALHNPKNVYKVEAHSWSPTGTPLTWGVQKWVPYIADTFKLDGFVWFSGVL